MGQNHLDESILATCVPSCRRFHLRAVTSIEYEDGITEANVRISSKIINGADDVRSSCLLVMQCRDLFLGHVEGLDKKLLHIVGVGNTARQIFQRASILRVSVIIDADK
jgi:hypothetical protein